ncbi:hypothetical protein HRbin16_02948 [bacterium HR16]|nr:hypothetical protein HRbin16_02948 [bacterium HR16]
MSAIRDLIAKAERFLTMLQLSRQLTNPNLHAENNLLPVPVERVFGN